MKTSEEIKYMLIGYCKEICEAFHVSKTLNHDPFKNHDETDKVAGKSYFTETPHAGIIPVYADEKETVKKILFISPTNNIGFESMTTSINPDAEGLVKEVHGCLQVVARSPIPWRNILKPTNIFSVILTKEEAGWAVASVHPGCWDVESVPDVLAEHEKKATDVLSFKEMEEWGILPRVVVE